MFGQLLALLQSTQNDQEKIAQQKLLHSVTKATHLRLTSLAARKNHSLAVSALVMVSCVVKVCTGENKQISKTLFFKWKQLQVTKAYVQITRVE